jgi:hypothetical protein
MLSDVLLGPADDVLPHPRFLEAARFGQFDLLTCSEDILPKYCSQWVDGLLSYWLARFRKVAAGRAATSRTRSPRNGEGFTNGSGVLFEC